MANFTAKDVKELREKTGAGMMDCKKALAENDGDQEKAVDYLRTKGLAAAQKKASRIAAEGLIGGAVEGNVGALVEINCETDFVAKNEDFKNFVSLCAQEVMKNNFSDLEAFKAHSVNGSTIQEQTQELTLKIGEKIDVRRFEKVELSGSGKVGMYIHGGKIGVLVKVETDNDDVNKNDKFNELVNDLCLHAAAADPRFLSADEIDEGFIKRETEIYETQLREQGKPENIIPNIVKGKLSKLASEVAFLEQKFVKDPDLSIKKLIDSVNKEVGSQLQLTSYTRIKLGDGIEKRVDNLAEEVAKMTK